MALNDYDTLIAGAAAQYNIDPRLLKSVMSVESNGVPTAVGPLITKGPAAGLHAQGLMQFIPPTAATYGVKNPFDPTQSIYGGAHYLSDLLNQHGSVDAAINAYSGGGGANYAGSVVAAYKAMPPLGTAASQPPPATGNPPSASPAPAAYRPPPTPGELITSGAVPGLISNRAQGTPTPLARSLVAAGVNPPTEPPNNIPSPSSNENQPPAPAAPEGGKTVLSPEEQQLIGGTPQKPAVAAPAVSPPAGATTLSPEERALVGAPASPQAASAPGTPAPSPNQPIMAPGPPPTAAALAPNVQVPEKPLMRPGGTLDPSQYSPDVIAQANRLASPPPSSPAGGVPAITSENIDALAGFSHGAREAVNPFLEFGSGIMNRLGNATGLPIQTDRVANDAASNAAFNAQYGNNPIAQGAAEGAKVGTPFVVGGAFGTALKAGLEAANLPRLASFLTGGGTGPAAPWYNRLASGVTAGGTQGLVAGGPWGAVTGAGIGAALQPIGTVANALYSRMAPEMAAAQRIYQALIRDGMSPDAAAAGVQRLGPLGSFADLEQAPNLRQLAEGVANRPGPGQAVAASNIIPRGEGQGPRLESSIQTVSGNPRSVFQTAEDLTQQQRAAARPLYDNALNNVPVKMLPSAQLAPYVNTPIGQRALRDGIANAQAEAVRDGLPVPSMQDYGVVQNPDGSLSLQPWNTTLKSYDAIKRGYDQIAESLRDPTTLRMNYSGSVPVPGSPGQPSSNISANNVIGLRDNFTRILRNAYPEYAQALDAWGGPASVKDAMEMGTRVLSQDAEQTAANVARMSPSQVEGYQAGVAQTLRDRVNRILSGTDAGQSMTPPNAVRAIFGNRQMRERLGAAFGGENTPAFQQFAQEVDNEAVFAQTQRRMFGGPDTARRLAAINQLEPGGAFDALTPLGHAVTGNLPGAAWNIGRQVMTPLLNRVVQPSDRMSLALGNMLFNPATQTQTMNMLRSGSVPSIRDVLMSPFSRAAIQQLLAPPQREEGRQ